MYVFILLHGYFKSKCCAAVSLLFVTSVQNILCGAGSASLVIFIKSTTLNLSYAAVGSSIPTPVKTLSHGANSSSLAIFIYSDLVN